MMCLKLAIVFVRQGLRKVETCNSESRYVIKKLVLVAVF